jgi:hypothetical protein
MHRLCFPFVSCVSRRSLLSSCFCLVHFPTSQDTDFLRVLWATLQHLYVFAGFNHASALFASTLFYALLSQIIADKTQLLKDSTYTGLRWANLRELVRSVKKYVFQTGGVWRAPPDQAETEEELRTIKRQLLQMQQEQLRMAGTDRSAEIKVC